MHRHGGEVELEKSVRRLREKFHGKIPIDKATVLMRRYGNNHRVVAMDIILMKDRDLDDEDRRSLRTDAAVRNVVQRLQAEEQEQATTPPQPRPQPAAGGQTEEDRDIQDLAEQLRALPLTRENLRMFDEAQQNHTPSDLHQFACQPCDLDWWRRVPQRKRMTRCGELLNSTVPAVIVSSGGSGVWMWGLPVTPAIPLSFRCESCPRRRQTALGYRRPNPHSCLAEDCYNRQEPHVPGTECVHPRSRTLSRKPRVVNPSPAHASSGSTVNTCLSQGSTVDLYQLILGDIPEEASDGSN
ncbi:hypothetical protein AAFF_G00122860 [Aldrovandia affinis]|uniref:Uncharacterized protein n=1 Tax=Aldrovandia affinis TaxID=143900 RepID=A0AAD7RRU8_9TELE|nr:hypothetical protein AAFF_G00122860 [Aldrovandia affinis]